MDSYPIFPLFYPELRVEIWDWFLILETRRRIVPYKEDAEMIVPIPQLYCPLLRVNHESRRRAKIFYKTQIPVYAFPDPDLDMNFGIGFGLLHLNLDRDILFMMTDPGGGQRSLESSPCQLSPDLQTLIRRDTEEDYDTDLFDDIYDYPDALVEWEDRKNYLRANYSPEPGETDVGEREIEGRAFRTRVLTRAERGKVTRIYKECPDTCGCSIHRDSEEEAPVPFNRVEFPAVWFCRRVNTAGIDQMVRNQLHGYPVQTNPVQTNPVQTNPVQTNPPQTNPPQTNPPQTNPPQTNPPQTNRFQITGAMTPDQFHFYFNSRFVECPEPPVKLVNAERDEWDPIERAPRLLEGPESNEVPQETGDTHESQATTSTG
ncbi:hypothetical protein F4779DRAFT_618886 [Xylariaceae sp. FL0662B]|nr:hypothetical protein F4779DRAFT_618886 [Xylariaceae sp. FL0662B]